jgi:hypothetical protein
MLANDIGDDVRDHAAAIARDAAASVVDPSRILEDEIEALQEQIALLEEGLPGAPRMERAALFKEITAYREELDAKGRKLRQWRDASK